MFRHVKTLQLELNELPPIDWTEQLSSFVDLETISEVQLCLLSRVDPDFVTANDIGKCLRLMPNLQSLEITRFSTDHSGLLASPQCSLLPSSVRHLKLSTIKLENFIPILERFDQLWSLVWQFEVEPSAEERKALGHWLDENRPGSSFSVVEHHQHYLWLGGKRMIPTNKRRKHNH